MDGRKAVFSNEEAAVDNLATVYFCDKMLIDKMLFEIDKGLQNGSKWGKKAAKSGEKKNFHFGDFGIQKWKNLPFLRQPWAASPQNCQKGASLITASSANLAKDAHRGRNGTSCPAMTPLRFVGARIAPTPP